MFRRALPLIAFALACQNDVVDDDAADLIDDGTATALTYPTDVATTPLYLDGQNGVYVNEETPWQYGLFELQAKATVRIALTGEPDHAVGMKVYRVYSDGSLFLLGSFDGPDGWVAVRLKSNFGGSYVVESVVNPLPATGQVAIDCVKSNAPDGRCMPQRQPGEMCGGIAGFMCADGLACTMSAGMCQVADAAGACGRQPQMCPMMFRPVCGCDGQTYSNGCAAAAAGMSVDHDGECACDPTLFDKQTDAVADGLPGPWWYSGERGIFYVGGALYLARTCSTEGLCEDTYTFDETLDPMCLADGCRVASYAFHDEGTWSFADGVLTLSPNPDLSSGQLATSFSLLANCEGKQVLETTEGDVVEQFARPIR